MIGRERFLLQKKPFHPTHQTSPQQDLYIRGQADEAKKQAEFIGLQTSILKSQDDDRLKFQSENIFAHEIQVLADLINTSLTAVTIKVGHDKDDNRLIAFHERKQRSRDDMILGFEDFLQKSDRDFRAVGGYRLDDRVVHAVELALETAANLEKRGTALGGHQALTLYRLRIGPLAEQLKRLLDINKATRSAASRNAIVEALIKDPKPDKT